MSVAAKAEGKRWFKGYGSDQYVYYAQSGENKFLGGCFEVAGWSDLEKYVDRQVCRTFGVNVRAGQRGSRVRVQSRN